MQTIDTDCTHFCICLYSCATGSKWWHWWHFSLIFALYPSNVFHRALPSVIIVYYISVIQLLHKPAFWSLVTDSLIPSSASPFLHESSLDLVALVQSLLYELLAIRCSVVCYPLILFCGCVIYFVWCCSVCQCVVCVVLQCVRCVFIGWYVV